MGVGAALAIIEWLWPTLIAPTRRRGASGRAFTGRLDGLLRTDRVQPLVRRCDGRISRSATRQPWPGLREAVLRRKHATRLGQCSGVTPDGYRERL